MFEDFRWNTVGPSSFVIVKTLDGFENFMERRWAVEIWQDWELWQVIYKRWIGCISMIEKLTDSDVRPTERGWHHGL